MDIVFANEDEAKTFTCEAEPLNALQVISEMCELAVVKIGIKGAMIKQGDEVVHVGIMAAAKRVDTTGAGDFYAAGFLSGLCDGLSLRQCGTIGAITAGKVIEVVGTTFGEEAWEDISRLVNKVKNEKYLFLKEKIARQTEPQSPDCGFSLRIGEKPPADLIAHPDQPKRLAGRHRKRQQQRRAPISGTRTEASSDSGDTCPPADAGSRRRCNKGGGNRIRSVFRAE